MSRYEQTLKWKQTGYSLQISEFPIYCLAIVKGFVFAATNKKIIGLLNVPNTEKIMSTLELDDTPIQMVAKSNLLFVLCKGYFIVYQLTDAKLEKLTSKKKERKDFIKMEWYSEVELLICDMSGEVYLFNIENYKFEEISGNLGLDYGLKTFTINTGLKKIFGAGIGHDLKCFELNSFEEEFLDTVELYEQTINNLTFFRNILFVEFHNRVSLYKIETNNQEQKLKDFKTIQAASQQTLASYQMDENKIVIGNNSTTDSKAYIWVYLFDSKSAKQPFKVIPNSIQYIECSEKITSLLFTDDVLFIGTTSGKLLRYD